MLLQNPSQLQAGFGFSRSIKSLNLNREEAVGVAEELAVEHYGLLDRHPVLTPDRPSREACFRSYMGSSPT